MSSNTLSKMLIYSALLLTVGAVSTCVSFKLTIESIDIYLRPPEHPWWSVAMVWLAAAVLWVDVIRFRRRHR